MRLLCAFLVFVNLIDAATFTVINNADSGAGSLRQALLSAAPDDTINFNKNLGIIEIGSTVLTALPVLTGVTINGHGNTISGQDTYPIFFALSGDNEINDLYLMNGAGVGGDGGSGSGGGGGAMGAGAGLFICPNATVALSNVSFSNCNVAGGNGGAPVLAAQYYGNGGGGGGGGYNSNGGSAGYLPHLGAQGSGGGGGGVFNSNGGQGIYSGGGGGGTHGSPGGDASGVGYLGSGAGGGGGTNISPGGPAGSVGSGGGGGANNAAGGSGDTGYGGGGGGGSGNSGFSPVGLTAGGTGGNLGGGDGGVGNNTTGNAFAADDSGTLLGGGGGGGSAHSGSSGNGGDGINGGGGGGYAGNASNPRPPQTTAGNGGNSSTAGGGGGGGCNFNGNGGNGGAAYFGGGGGGAQDFQGEYIGGNGGSSTIFGGGGGGGAGGTNGTALGGNGGLGGGGGGAGCPFSSPGVGGFGGGTGGVSSGSGMSPCATLGGTGGGGSAFGGAVFIANNATLTMLDGDVSGNHAGPAGTGSTPGAVAGDGFYLMPGGSNVVFNVSKGNTLTLEDNFAGDGTVTKSGSGTLVLSADNAPFTGTTIVEKGTLALLGELEGSVEVDPQGVLSGTGQIHSSLVNNGTVSPGYPTGVLTENGPYTQGPNGVLFINAKSGSAGQLNVLQANLNGTLTLNLLKGAKYKNGDQIVVLISGQTIVGKFSNFVVQNAPDNLGATVVYKGKQVIITFQICAPPVNLSGKQIRTGFLAQTEYANQITWEKSPSPGIISYAIYRNGAKIATISASSPLIYVDHNQPRGVAVTYEVRAQSSNLISLPATVVIR